MANNNKLISHYLIPVNIKNIHACFTTGLIMPIIFESEDGQKNREKDIQSDFAESIVLTPNKIKFYKNANLIFLEVVLFPHEENRLSRHNNETYLYPEPLPVSRICAIHSRPDILEEELSLVETYEDCFIPEQLMENLNTKSKNKKQQSEFNFTQTESPEKNFANKHEFREKGNSEKNNIESNPKDKVDTQHNDLRKKIKQYDRILGMFSFMRNTKKYYKKFFSFDEPIDIDNFDLIDILALSIINNTIFKIEQIKNIGHIKTEKSDKLIKMFEIMLFKDKDNQVDSETKKLLMNIIEAISDDKIFSKETTEHVLDKTITSQDIDINQEKKAKITNYFESIFDKNFLEPTKLIYQNKNLRIYILLSILHHYNHKSTTSIEAYKSQFKGIIVEKGFLPFMVSAVLGFYYGYAKLPVNEKIESSMNKSSQGSNFPMKYTVLNIFERLLIESVYQHTFCQKSHIPSISDYESFISSFESNMKNPDMMSPGKINYQNKDYAVIDKGKIISFFSGIKHKIEDYQLYPYDLFFLRSAFNEDQNHVNLEDLKNYIKNRIEEVYPKEKIEQSKYLSQFFIGEGFSYKIEILKTTSNIICEKKDILTFISKKIVRISTLKKILMCIELDDLNGGDESLMKLILSKKENDFNPASTEKL